MAARVHHMHDIISRVEHDLKRALEKIECHNEELARRMNEADKAAARVSAAIAVVLGLLSSAVGSVGSSKLASWLGRLIG